MNLFARQVRTLMTAATAAVGVFVWTAAAQTAGTLTDKRDGKTYKTVKIGEQVWMAQNLNYKTKSGSWCYGEGGQVFDGFGDNKYPIYRTLSSAKIQANCGKYGRLYNWKTAKTVCPSGFHLPYSQEWQRLVDYAGGYREAGKNLKARSGWNDAEGSSGNGTDDFGWFGLPGGCREFGDFSTVGYGGLWWTATEDIIGGAYLRGMDYNNDNVGEINDSKDYGYSVRCVADPE